MYVKSILINCSLSFPHVTNLLNHFSIFLVYWAIHFYEWEYHHGGFCSQGWRIVHFFSHWKMSVKCDFDIKNSAEDTDFGLYLFLFTATRLNKSKLSSISDIIMMMLIWKGRGDWERERGYECYSRCGWSVVGSTIMPSIVRVKLKQGGIEWVCWSPCLWYSTSMRTRGLVRVGRGVVFCEESSIVSHSAYPLSDPILLLLLLLIMTRQNEKWPEQHGEE
jgi:hypothetical protein